MDSVKYRRTCRSRLNQNLKKKKEKMATQFLQLLYMSCMILHVCSVLGLVLQGAVACDVPDDAVDTELHRYVRIGDNVSLICRFCGTPSAVYWKKLDDPIGASTVVSWKTGDPVTGSCGERPCQLMEMNAEFSLIINEVSIAEQGKYICRVINYKGKGIQNFTEISVFSPPQEPYPIINDYQRSCDMKSIQTCVISTAEDPINLTCSASGYFPDLNLLFLHNNQSITSIHSEETTNGDGKKTQSITVQASPSPELYMCVASDIPGVGGRREASVTVTTALVDGADRKVTGKIVGSLLFIIVLAVAVGAFILWRNQQQEPISYVELWKLNNETDVTTGNVILSKLVGTPEENLGKEDRYTRLCEWKEGSSATVRLLYQALKEHGFHDELQAMKDFRACTSVLVADDVLEHICSQVRSCEEETINPILRALYREGSCPILSTYKSLEDDLNMMKRWKSSPMSGIVTYCRRSEEVSIQLTQDDEMTPMNPGSGEVHPNEKTAPPNQLIRLCLALEEAGKTVDTRPRPVYMQLAKTLYKDFSVPSDQRSVIPPVEPHSQTSRDEEQSLQNRVPNEDFSVPSGQRSVIPPVVPHTLTRRDEEQSLQNKVFNEDFSVPSGQRSVIPPVVPHTLTRRDEEQSLQNKVFNEDFSVPSGQKSVIPPVEPDTLTRRDEEQSLQNKVFNEDVSVPRDQSSVIPPVEPDTLTRRDKDQCLQNGVPKEFTSSTYPQQAMAPVQPNARKGRDMLPCGKHDEPFLFYCKKHKIFICHLCATKSHGDVECELEDINDLISERERRQHEIEKSVIDRKEKIRLINEEADKKIRIINEERDGRINAHNAEK